MCIISSIFLFITLFHLQSSISTIQFRAPGQPSLFGASPNCPSLQSAPHHREHSSRFHSQRIHRFIFTSRQVRPLLLGKTGTAQLRLHSVRYSFTAYKYGVVKTCSSVPITQVYGFKTLSSEQENTGQPALTDYADTSNSGAIRSATPSNFFFQASNLSASLPICVRDRTRGCTHVITAFWSTWSIEPRINFRLNPIC